MHRGPTGWFSDVIIEQMDDQDSDEGFEDVDHPRGGFCHLLDTMHCDGHLVRVSFI